MEDKTSKSITLEKASEADIPIFHRLEREAGTEAFVAAYDIEEHVRCLNEDSTRYLRIVSSDKLAGFFLLNLDVDQLSVEFRRVVVARNERGIGQRAITLMEQYCEQTLERKRIWLDVYETNSRARHIYEKLGYQVFGRTTHNARNLLYYEKELS